MNLKTLNDRLSQLELRQDEQKLVVWYKGDGETYEEALERHGIPEDYPRERLTVLTVVYEDGIKQKETQE